MAVFDEYIRKVNDYIRKMLEKDLPEKKFYCPEPVDEIKAGLPVKVGPKANPGIILRGDTFLELGNPNKGSKSLLLWTNNTNLIKNGNITLIGPDIQDSPNASLPFAQIILAAGESFKGTDQENLEIAPHVADQIEGYMVKSSTGNVWARVSKDAAEKGLSFEVLGKALMVLFRSNIPKTQAMEVIFITSGKEDVLQLDDIEQKTKTIRRELVKENWKAKGYDLDCDFDCGSCVDQSVCDDIRDVIVSRKKKEDV